MWRDILLILAFLIAALTYFGLTPGRIIRYFMTTKAEVTKKELYQKISLLIMVLVSLSAFVLVRTREDLPLENTFMVTFFVVWMWKITFTDVWKLSERGDKIVDMVCSSIAVLSLIAVLILADIPLWKKIAYPIGGFGIGYGSAKLKRYIERRVRRRRSSKDK